LGSLLIKRAAKAMAAQNPALERFVTLSPVPTFRSWLDSALQQRRETGESSAVRLAAAEANDLQLLYPGTSSQTYGSILTVI
jgi:malonyl-CoA decarboxylase